MEYRMNYNSKSMTILFLVLFQSALILRSTHPLATQYFLSGTSKVEMEAEDIGRDQTQASKFTSKH